MHQLLAVASRSDWPTLLNLCPYDLERVDALNPAAVLPDVVGVIIVPGSSEAVAAAVRSAHEARPEGDLALFLGGWPALQPLSALLTTHPFDGVLDLDWPDTFVRSCITTVLRNVEHGRNMVQIQGAVLEQTRTETASLYDLSVKDDLTHLFNHRHFAQLMAREHDRNCRRGTPYALMFIDLDNLKQLNTRLGHAGGSRALRELAQVLTESLRSSDVALRIGGDEFVLFLAGCDKKAAGGLANRLCERLRTRQFLVDTIPTSITISVGVASFPEDGAHYPELLARADHALLRAKANGRDRAEVWSAEIDSVGPGHSAHGGTAT